VADTPKHSVSVAGIVVRGDGRILAIQRRDNQHWEPPGGVLELNETFEDGVRREILEETGVEVDVERLTGVYKNMMRGIVALVFRCRPINGRGQASDEARRIDWLSADEATDQMDPAYAVRVLDALADVTAVRVHDGTNVLAR
jgi:8-oxo-dGTP diphosphatase